MKADGSLSGSFPQYRMIKAILWLLDHKRKNSPSRPAFHTIYRAEIIRKAKVNHANLTEFIEKLIRESVIVVIPTWDREDEWWAFEVTEEGERRLREEVRFYED